MPRTTTVECPGCPPIRAFTFDTLGLIKVIESRGDRGIPQVVERWGDPDSSKCLLAASIDDRKQDPLLAVARKNGEVEVRNPLNGDIHAVISNKSDAKVQAEGDSIAGLHLFRRERLSGSCTLLTCTSKGNASTRSIEFKSLPENNAGIDVSKTWKVCGSGNISCFKVDGSEKYAVFGGKGVEVNLWDLENCTKIWTAKSPPRNSLDIFTPTWFTCAAFMTNEDHRKFVAGTNSHQLSYGCAKDRNTGLMYHAKEPLLLYSYESMIHDVSESYVQYYVSKQLQLSINDLHIINWQTSSLSDLKEAALELIHRAKMLTLRSDRETEVRLYDTAAQRRPVMSFDFRETPIKAVTEDRDGNTIYIGNGSGDLASFDIRTGKLLGCFLGKCSGSIKSIARHPCLPVIASCGLDSYLRLWDIETRQLLSAIFLKQHLVSVVLDSNFKDNDKARVVEAPSEDADEVPTEDEMEPLPVKRNKASKEKMGKRKGSKEVEAPSEDADEVPADYEMEPLPVKRKKASKEKKGKRKSSKEEGSKKEKSKKKRHKLESDVSDDSDS